MITTICALALSLTTCPESAVASRYDLSPTVHTLEARLDIGHITPEQVQSADGFVAVGDCSRIGEWVYVRSLHAAEWLRMLVFGCAGDAESAAFMERAAVEVDYWTAQAWGFTCECAWPVEVVIP